MVRVYGQRKETSGEKNRTLPIRRAGYERSIELLGGSEVRLEDPRRRIPERLRPNEKFGGEKREKG
jgi:hypothetical protein